MDWSEYENNPLLAKFRKPGIHFVPGEGPMNPDIMLIGEAPGELENASRRPFVGKAGEILNEILETIGRKREDVYITNVIKYWPIDDKGKTETPSPAEIILSTPSLMMEVMEVNPKIIGLCGHTAITAVFPGITSVNEFHGQLLGEKFVPLYHPITVSYKPPMKGKVIKGYKMLNEHLIGK